MLTYAQTSCALTRRRAARPRWSRREPGCRRGRRSSCTAPRARRASMSSSSLSRPSHVRVELHGPQAGGHGPAPVFLAPPTPAASRVFRSPAEAELLGHHRQEALAGRSPASSAELVLGVELVPGELQETEERLEDAAPRDGARPEHRLSPSAREDLDLLVGPHAGEVPLVELDHERHLGDGEPELTQVVAKVDEGRGVGLRLADLRIGDERDAVGPLEHEPARRRRASTCPGTVKTFTRRLIPFPSSAPRPPSARKTRGSMSKKSVRSSFVSSVMRRPRLSWLVSWCSARRFVVFPLSAGP